MQLNTKNFGLIEIDEKNIIEFPEGLPGFEDKKRFTLLGKMEEEPYFDWLQSIEDMDLVFVTINPKFIIPEYYIDVEQNDIEFLKIKDENKVLIYAIVVIPEDIEEMSANLKAPIIINTENNIGKQLVLENKQYQIRHYILEEIKK